jgi:amino acid adenylation domain-containing protein
VHDNSPSDQLTLDRLLDRPAAERPDALALTDGSIRSTWSEYRDAADGLAGAIRAAGARPGDRVAVHLSKSAASFVAVHGVLRAGCTMVPLDWFAPADHTASILADADVRAVVTEATGDRLDDLTGRGRIGSVHPSERAPAPSRPGVTPEDPAYIIYTSGSTGRPKGILHTHASALAYARRAVETYDLAPTDRLANVAPLHFDQSTFELYAGPLAGAAAIVIPDGVLRFPASTGKLISAEHATVWYSVPYAITQLVTRGAPADLDLSALRWVLFGGESYPIADLTAAMRRLPGARFSNVYGPAEVNQCTFFHLDAPPEQDLIPIGRAWDGVELRLVDPDGAEIVEPTDGAVGELWVSGDTMMASYWNRPELTDAAIVADADGRRWYRTGDLVARSHVGDLTFLGRVDHQVKVRGHRIELEAIELAVTELSGVEACAVVVDDDRLVAVVEPELDGGAAKAVLASLRDRLPRYAVPSAVIGVSRMPRTGTGKVDRRAAAEHLQGSD